MTLQEIKNKTLLLLGSDKIDQVDYITEDLIKKNETAEDEHLSSDKAITVIEGHNMRYGAWDENGNTVQGYIYERGSSYTGSGCGNDYTRRLAFIYWDHHYLGKCSDGSDLLRFTKR